MQDLARQSERELVDPPRHSPLATARVRRNLSAEELAVRAGITPAEVAWLEEGRVYRFASPDDALLACVLYAAALGIDEREARELAGLPAPRRTLGSNPLGRLVAVAAIAALLSAIGVAVAFSTLDLGAGETAPPPARRAGPALPAPWRVQVDVLNGSGDINRTRRIADRITALGYTVKRVTRADRFDYPQTAVYFQRGGERIATRLARSLGVVTKPLPGGSNPLRQVVIVGPARGPDG